MRIAVTGGSGSLGRALITRLAKGGADRIVTFSRDEQKRNALAAEFAWHPGVRVFAGDVRDERRLVDLFHGCEVVIHAAARKVVTAHPDEPEELLKTNILGTQAVIEAARQARVQKLVLVSSDKAVAAENVYGVSKAMGEHLAVMANARTFPQGLRIGVVRYGNVLGSTGSVLPYWRKLAAEGKPLPVSDVLMSRFWITLPDAVTLVLDVVANLRGGEIVVPHLPAAPIIVLAQTVLPNGVSRDSFTELGIRPGGEKLHESLLSDSEVRRAVRCGDTYLIPPFQHEHMWDNRPWLGTPVDSALVYRSDVWPWQLDVTEMRKLTEVL